MKTILVLGAAILLANVPLRAATESPWEISVGGDVSQLSMKFDTKGTQFFEDEPLSDKTDKTVFSPSITVSKVIHRADGAVWRLGLGYNYASGKVASGEHESGEGPGELYTLDISTLEVKAHQIKILADVAWKVAPAWEAGLRAGPTLTIFNGNFSGSHETFVQESPTENGPFVSGGSSSDNSTKAAIGVTGEAFIRYTPEGSKVFIEVHAGYSWTDKVRFGSSAIGAEVDGSAFKAGISVGFKF